MIYLDHAATSFPKPRSVMEEQARCMREYCGNAGRGSHALARAAAEKIYECREEAALLFGVSNPARIIFTWNTTMALNIAIKGLLRKGDHVLLSDMEHNAVYRPIWKMADEGRIDYSLFPTLVADPNAIAADVCAEIEERITPRTRMLICTHASNLCSLHLPIKEIGALCKRYGIFFVVDAAQSAGHVPIHAEMCGIDALCVPGHKGLWGPQGSGMLILGPDVRLDTLMEGGSGYRSLLAEMPEDYPERYEAGTLPTPAIAGLCEGIRAVRRIGADRIGERERELFRYMRKRLSRLERVWIYASHHEGAVLLFNVMGEPSERVGRYLSEKGICVRSGFHCSALGHQTLGTLDGGAVRASVGFSTTRSHIDALTEALRSL